MELINQTTLATELSVSTFSKVGDGVEMRLGVIVAKATLERTRDGSLQLCAVEDALPILRQPVPTELGLLPSDVILRETPQLDVIVLSAAYAPGARPVANVTVAVQVGEHRSELVVTGDRVWSGHGPEAIPSEPQPFTRMPMTWERTFGGTVDVWIDGSTVLPVSDPLNPKGRGFDPHPMVDGLQRTLGCAPTFPRLDSVRVLPNVEHPSDRVRRWEDRPLPGCWATLPPELGNLASRPHAMAYRRALITGKAEAAGPQEPPSSAWWDLRLPVPEGPLPFVLDGCHPRGRWEGIVPPIRPSVDYEIGARRGSLDLEPVILVFLPEQDRLAITYHRFFRFKTRVDDARSMRLRYER